MSTAPTIRPKVAVIIPHFNDHARLALCLQALAVNMPEAAEVVVVDNGSTPDPAELLASFPFARLVLEPLRGAAAARNRGVAETTAEVLMFLDADCIPRSDWLPTGLALARPGTIVGGRIDVFAETPGPLSGAEAFEMVFAFHQNDYVERKRFSVTANLVTSRRLFEETGPFIVGLSEDLDWCHRALAKGATISYADTLVVAHPARTDWPALRKKWRRLTQEAFTLCGDIRAERLLWLVRAFAMLPSAFLHAPQVMTSQALPSLTTRFCAVLTLLRLRAARAAWMIGQAISGKP